MEGRTKDATSNQKQKQAFDYRHLEKRNLRSLLDSEIIMFTQNSIFIFACCLTELIIWGICNCLRPVASPLVLFSILAPYSSGVLVNDRSNF